MPIGALLGGVLGAVIGLRPTIVVGAVGLLVAPLWIVRWPDPAARGEPRRLRAVPRRQRSPDKVPGSADPSTRGIGLRPTLIATT